MNKQDKILNEITRKQLILYGHVERMDPPKIMINWKPLLELLSYVRANVAPAT